MIERVARAIHAKTRGLRGALTFDGNDHVGIRQEAMEQARVAIAAMREPTQKMLDDAALMRGRWDSLSHTEQWQYMIDAALKEGE